MSLTKPTAPQVRIGGMRFSIRDVLWLTALVAVTLALWLGWSREVARLKADHAARVAKLEKEYQHAHEQFAESWNAQYAEYTRVRAQLRKHEAQSEGR